MERKRCFFIGANKINPCKERALQEKLNSIINQLLEEGVSEFYSVIDVGFELLATKCVAEAKAVNKDIVLYIKFPVTEKMATNQNLEDIKTVCSIADAVSPYVYSDIDQNAYWLYALYIHNVDVIVVYRENSRRVLKSKTMNTIIEDYVRPRTKIIEVKI